MLDCREDLCVYVLCVCFDSLRAYWEIFSEWWKLILWLTRKWDNHPESDLFSLKCLWFSVGMRPKILGKSKSVWVSIVMYSKGQKKKSRPLPKEHRFFLPFHQKVRRRLLSLPYINDHIHLSRVLCLQHSPNNVLNDIWFSLCCLRAKQQKPKGTGKVICSQKTIIFSMPETWFHEILNILCHACPWVLPKCFPEWSLSLHFHHLNTRISSSTSYWETFLGSKFFVKFRMEVFFCVCVCVWIGVCKNLQGHLKWLLLKNQSHF